MILRRWLWRYVVRFAYWLYSEPVTTVPVGLPGHRDPEAYCGSFSPRKRHPADVPNCRGDGHYLCRECALYTLCEEEVRIDAGRGEPTPVSVTYRGRT